MRETFRDLENIGVLVLVNREDPTRHRPREYRINLDRLHELAATSSVAPPEPRSPIPGTWFPHPPEPRSAYPS